MVCIDSTTVQAHPWCGWKSEKAALGGRGGRPGPRRVEGEDFISCDGPGRPLPFSLTAGNVNDFT